MSDREKAIQIQGLAMHLINARDKAQGEAAPGLEEQYDDILDRTTAIIETELGVRVRRDTFNYARFATHVQYQYISNELKYLFYIIRV